MWVLKQDFTYIRVSSVVPLLKKWGENIQIWRKTHQPILKVIYCNKTTHSFSTRSRPVVNLVYWKESVVIVWNPWEHFEHFSEKNNPMLISRPKGASHDMQWVAWGRSCGEWYEYKWWIWAVCCLDVVTCTYHRLDSSLMKTFHAWMSVCIDDIRLSL